VTSNPTGARLGLVALLGPTAAGKSHLALSLARWLRQRGQPAEIVSADSMLVYRGMDIGTAKPNRADRADIRHHLVDIMDLGQTASVAQFQSLARAAISACQDRGVQPILAGGSALYLRAVLDQFDFPGQDLALRRRLEDELAERGPEALHQRLAALDPAAAAAIQPRNGRRLVRALEVVALAGSFSAHLPEPRYALPDVVQIGLDLPRARMDWRIGQRTEAMWRDGLIDEVRNLLGQGLRQAPTAARAIGYRQAIDQIDGRLSPAEAQEQTALRTRQFSRKQLAWWRRDPRVCWLPAEPTPRPEAIAALVPWWRDL